LIKGNGWEIPDTSSYPYSPAGQYSKWSGPVNISYAINYLVENGKARVVVNPKIIITNGEESKIEVTEDYLESVDVDSSTSTGGTVITRDYNIGNDKGVTVSIVPFISPDGYVTMNITPEYSTEAGSVTGVENTATGDRVTYLAATLLSHRNLELKNIRIKDGETLVIAGMIQEGESKTVNKVPLLGDIPVIGTVFRSTTSKKTKSEMVIMLTPKIITDNEDAVAASDNL
jgi:type IV pilus assembly protein PilQ